MRVRIGARLLVALSISTALALTGCSGGGGTVSDARMGSQDINPKPREAIQDGGELRWPIDSLPNNYNYNQVDGTTEDCSNIVGAVLPSLFTATAEGGLRLNPDYLTSAELTSTTPQVITYTINPKAIWSDGTPISWRDFESYWRAQNGTNPAFQTSGTSGFSDIGSVTRGIDDRQAVVRFTRPYAEWRNLFNPFYPASTTSTPQAFNTAWATTIPVTAGPFTLEAIDQTAKTVILKRDPRWWGTPAKLDRIIFRAFERSAQPDALANNEIDYYQITSSLDLLRRAQSIPGAVVRNAPSRSFNHLTFNGSPGAILSDRGVRQAVAQGIDRAALTQRMIGQIQPGAAPDGNHLYPPLTKNYRDNADVLRYDPAAAERALDALGWVRPAPSAPRAKNGKPLSLRLIYYNAGSNEDIVRTVQNQLGQIGVTVVPQQYPGPEFDTNLTRGAFDLANFGWGGTASPMSSAVGIYATPAGDNVRQNYGRISDPEIDKLFAEGTAELDDTKRAEIGNRIDALIWREVHSVVLYARPGAVAVRSTLANFGAQGLADVDYINAGFVK